MKFAIFLDENGTPSASADVIMTPNHRQLYNFILSSQMPFVLKLYIELNTLASTPSIIKPTHEIKHGEKNRDNIHRTRD